jgi:glycosyltransferase involved in cell wall biosynthesis
MKVLAICIPTFNMGPWILQALNSINNNKYSDLIEIIISDNCSSDATEQFVEEFMMSYDNVTYIKLLKNIGADKNFLNVVSNVSARYTYILGADDFLVEGAIEKIIEIVVSEKPKILIFDRIVCDVSGNSLHKESPVNLNRPLRINLNSPDDIFYYINIVNGYLGFFSYLSNVVFETNSWNESALNNRNIGLSYVHTFKHIATFFGEKGSLIYLNQALVYSRSGNCSFSGAGYTRRVLIDLLGFYRIFQNIPSNYQNVFLKKYYAYNSKRRLLKLSLLSNKREWNLVKNILFLTKFNCALSILLILVNKIINYN